ASGSNPTSFAASLSPARPSSKRGNVLSRASDFQRALGAGQDRSERSCAEVAASKYQDRRAPELANFAGEARGDRRRRGGSDNVLGGVKGPSNRREELGLGEQRHPIHAGAQDFKRLLANPAFDATGGRGGGGQAGHSQAPLQRQRQRR